MILRKAASSEVPKIWQILQEAIDRRKQEGSKQWQSGYPNERSVANDLTNGYSYVLADEDEIMAYAAIIFDGEPAYEAIRGNWLTDGTYVTIHRVATSGAFLGKGMATKLFKMIEDLSLKEQIYSIRVDTNFDNIPMLKILSKLNYTYCGEVFFDGEARKAYEKVIIE